jgi:hypothetical protein
MLRPKLPSLLLVVPALLVALVQEVSAAPFITVTGCDTVTVAGVQRMRITFSVHNSSNIDISEVSAIPVQDQAPGDTCRAIQEGSPPLWTVAPNGFFSPGWVGSPAIHPGQTLSGYSVVLTRLACCFTFVFSDVVFDQVSEDVCWSCPLATAAQGSSWGRLKVVYR